MLKKFLKSWFCISLLSLSSYGQGSNGQLNSFDSSLFTYHNLSYLSDLPDYFGPKIGLKYETEWIDDYRNEQFAKNQVRKYSEAYIVEGALEQETVLTKISKYDRDGFITDVEYFNSIVHVETTVGSIKLNKREQYHYDRDRHVITKVIYTKFLKQIDTLYIVTTKFDQFGRRKEKTTNSISNGDLKNVYYRYDTFNNCISESSTLNAYPSMNMRYNNEGSLVFEMMYNDTTHASYYEYDSKQRLIKKITFGDTISIQYDSLGNVAHICFDQKRYYEGILNDIKKGHLFPLDLSFCEKGEYNYCYSKNGVLEDRSYCCENKSYFLLGEGPAKIIYLYTKDGLLESAREAGLDEQCDGDFVYPYTTFNWLSFYEFWD